jgi:hypothetical protein
MAADDVHFFFQLRDQLKLYHWQTRVYARHVATDTILESLEKSIDSFVEIYIAKYGRPRLTGKNAIITVHNISESGAIRLVHTAMKYIQGPLSKRLQSSDTDLFNIRDELLANLNQLLYLFTLK